MLKFIFWSLLLANVGLFVYQQGYLNSVISDGREPTRMDHQFHTELMKPIAATALASAASTGTSATSTSSPASIAAATATKTEVLLCKEIGSFDSTGAKRFETLLQPLGLGDKLTRKDSEEVANNIVYIPSQGSKEGADKKANELKHLGVTDFYVIQDAGEFHWGISLGVFKTEEAARALLASLNQKGVHSARLGSHTVAATKVTFQLQGVDSASLAGVEKITADFPHVETYSCDKAAASDAKAANGKATDSKPAGSKPAESKTASQTADAHPAKPAVPREVTH